MRPMRVITAQEAEAIENGYYHLLDEHETKSVCGAVEEDDLFAGEVGDILTRKEAEERGLQPCEQCLTYTGEK